MQRDIQGCPSRALMPWERCIPILAGAKRRHETINATAFSTLTNRQPTCLAVAHSEPAFLTLQRDTRHPPG